MIDNPITLRALTITRIVDVTPGIRRFTLGGAELGPVRRDGVDCPAFVTGAADDHIKIFPPTSDPLVLPTQDHGHLHWPENPPAVARDYTVCRFDAAAGELDIEALLHHDGPGARWADEAQVGDTLHIAGPRSSHALPDDVPLILIGDDAALPAIARFLAEAADDSRITVIVVLDEINASYPLPDQFTQRLIRSQPNADPPEVFDAVRAALAAHPDAFVWAALEFRTSRDLRAVLREANIPRQQTLVTHYWRRPTAAAADVRAAAEAALRPMVDLLTPTVLRVAVTIGLPSAIFAGAHTVETAAARTGCDQNAIGVILGYLATQQVVRKHSDDTYELTATGELLLPDDPSGYHDYLHLHLASGQMASSLPGLLHAVETGRSAYEHVHGRGFWDALSAEPTLGTSFDRQLAGWAAEWVPDIARLHVWAEVGRVVDVGGGAAVLATAVAVANPHLDVTIVELAGPAERAHQTVIEHGVADRVDVVVGSFFDPLPTAADIYVLAQVLHDWPDDEAGQILARCAEALADDGRLLILERLPDPGDASSESEHSAMSVLMLALFGARERTVDDYRALLADRGLSLTRIDRLPAGLCVIEARRAIAHRNTPQHWRPS